MRKFSKRTREYIIVYHAIENHEQETKSLTSDKKGSISKGTVRVDDSTVIKVERMKRTFRIRRCAMDSDTKCIKSEIIVID